MKTSVSLPFKLVEYRLVLIVLTQMALVAVSLATGFVLRFDLIGVTEQVEIFLQALPVFIGVKLAAFYAYDLYRGWWRYAGMSDLLDIIKANAVSLVAIYLLITLVTGPSGFPRTIYLLDLILSVGLIGGVRFVTRLYTESIAAQGSASTKNLIVVGAGNTGRMMVREIRQNPAINLNPVGFLDDDPTKRGAKVEGVRVLGTTDDLPRLAGSLGVQDVLIAIPTATGEQMTKIVRLCQESGAVYKTVPAVGDLINGRLSLAQIRSVNIEDLLGRQVVEIESEHIRREFAGRTVLITGAGGSIGSELARQVCGFDPRKVLLYDRSENDLYHIELELRQKFPSLAIVPIAGDILDIVRLEEVFCEHLPQAVLHAAAYKHVPMMEAQPFAAICNNVFGTFNVASMAARFRVDTFLLISTDKAVNPTNVMGVSKRIAELVTLGLAEEGETRFCAVRFGNVLGSNGSVVPLFKSQIATRQPVTVTDPEVTRYFMTIPEAVRLVLQATSMANGRDVFILDMGKPVRILDLARNLIRLSGLEPERDIPIVFTGLRPGEKRYEELLTATEGLEKTGHPKVFCLMGDLPAAQTVEGWLVELRRLAEQRDVAGLVAFLKAIVPEYTPSGDLTDTVLRNNSPTNLVVKELKQ